MVRLHQEVKIVVIVLFLLFLSGNLPAEAKEVENFFPNQLLVLWVQQLKGRLVVACKKMELLLRLATLWQFLSNHMIFLNITICMQKARPFI